MDVTIPAPGSRHAFEDACNFELFPVDRAIFVRGNNDHRISHLYFHASST